MKEEEDIPRLGLNRRRSVDVMNRLTWRRSVEEAADRLNRRRSVDEATTRTSGEPIAAEKRESKRRLENRRGRSDFPQPYFDFQPDAATSSIRTKPKDLN
ncbi:hypothetical protein F2Q68_00044692 [Brassica cretica]|uniref:Uncharacterized protein n=1 Tax=Brassica cretica TaxID=69181 RepID=A0A8S9LUC1_BRACR|nr:hypothetical protein F2Q68_00044692 [Brassica cretica]